MNGFPRVDLWAIAKVLASQELNGEISLVSEANKPLINLLASMKPHQRIAGFQGATVSRPDHLKIQRAVADIDPMLPPPTGPDGSPESSLEVKLIRASTIKVLLIDWLWESRVPLGMLTLFAGDPKLGKSFATLYLAAMVSRGAELPGGGIPDGPGSVIIMSAEDDPARVIVPRLKAMGADLTKIHILESVISEKGKESLPSLAEDVGRIKAAADSLGDCRLIIIDPVSAYLGGIDDHRNAELRGVLSPLKAMAEAGNLAVILVSHMGKSGGTNGKYRVIGSIAYVGACRANFLFVKDRDDPTGARVLMLDNGGNLAPPAATLAYTIVCDKDGPRVDWCQGTVDITAEQALAADQAAQQAERGEKVAPERSDAELWLKEMLGDGPMLVRELEEFAKNGGIKTRTLERAKKNLGVESFKEGFKTDAKWFWRLPND